MSNIKFESSKSESPNKFVDMLAIGAGASLLTGALGAIGAGRQKRRAERKERKARQEMDRLRSVYSNLDTSNPYADLTNQYAGLQNRYAGLENTMEDLTVNQQQAQFEAQQFQQSQANILGDLRGAAGGSGIASLAQSLAQQGQIAAQRSSASIGAQEAANQRAAAASAGRLQEMEAGGAARLDLQRASGQASIDQMRAAGERQSQQMEFDKQGTLLGMSQMETAAYMQQAQDANRAKWDAISGGIGGALDMAGMMATGQ